jgi:hypothetical protein
MIRVLPLLAVALKVWMLIDARNKRQEYYWFFIILFAPFGALIYFFLHKLDDIKWHKLASPFRSPPSIDQLKFRYSETPCVANRLALADGLAAAGRHVEAIVEYEGVLAGRPDEHDALWGLALSRAALGELEQAAEVLTRLVAAAPSYGDWEPWVMLAGLQHKRGLREESLETVRTLARKSARADHQMLLAEALIAADCHDEAAAMLDRIIAGHEHAPDYIRRRDRKVVGRARRLRDDMARTRARAATSASA